MKKIILSVFAAFMINVSHAQVNKKDTVMLDSTQVEKIQKMPMDSMHHNMPIAPLKDTIMYRKSPDDADPKKSESPK